ncbi:ATP-binding cassette domain-containing protein [Bacillus thuringiensis]|uniref:ATP-binding cassette domain-containing protein n=1 Tax=Bacillus thuringiensis TaxID=1428 RepID=UPI00347C614D
MKTDESISLNTEFEKSAPALQLSKLHKRFGEFIAVNRIDLTIPSGSFYGVVGPNGAGKTTSLSMAVGLLRPDGCFVQAAIPEKCRKNSRGAQLLVLNVNFGISRR